MLHPQTAPDSAGREPLHAGTDRVTPRRPPRAAPRVPPDRVLVTELLVLPSGELLVHNLTPTFAGVLARLGFRDDHGRVRGGASSRRFRPRPMPGSIADAAP
jgi:hypothetical protein